MKKLHDLKDLEILKNNFEEKRNLKRKSKITIFKNDYFSKSPNKEFEFETYFTDELVIKLLQKLSNKSIKNLLVEFEKNCFKNTKNNSQLKITLHNVANELLKKYGSKIISFLIDLQVLNADEDEYAYKPKLDYINLDPNKVIIDPNKIIGDIKKENLSFEIIKLNEDVKTNTSIGEFNSVRISFLDFHMFKLYEIKNRKHEIPRLTIYSQGTIKAIINKFGEIDENYPDQMNYDDVLELLKNSKLYYYDLGRELFSQQITKGSKSSIKPIYTPMGNKR